MDCRCHFAGRVLKMCIWLMSIASGSDHSGMCERYRRPSLSAVHTSVLILLCHHSRASCSCIPRYDDCKPVTPMPGVPLPPISVPSHHSLLQLYTTTFYPQCDSVPWQCIIRRGFVALRLLSLESSTGSPSIVHITTPVHTYLAVQTMLRLLCTVLHLCTAHFRCTSNTSFAY
jgi:hypothetical protein